MHISDMTKKGFRYVSGFSVEKPCIGGEGSKPAFTILKDMFGVKVTREYSIYQGQSGFKVWTKTKQQMINALNKLNSEYSWISKNDSFETISEHERMFC